MSCKQSLCVCATNRHAANSPRRSCWNPMKMKVISQSDLFSSALSGNFKPWAGWTERKTMDCAAYVHFHKNIFFLFFFLFFYFICGRFKCSLMCLFFGRFSRVKKEMREWGNVRRVFRSQEHWQTLAELLFWPARGPGPIFPCCGGELGVCQDIPRVIFCTASPLLSYFVISF